MSDRAATGERLAAGWLPASADVLAYGGVVACYAATVLAGMALANEAAALGLVLFRDPGDVGNVGTFAAVVLVGTAIMLAAFRYGRGETLVRLLLVGSFAVLVGDALVLAFGVGSVVTGPGPAQGLPASPAPQVAALATVAVLWWYPEWYVVDAAAIVGGAVAIPMFGLGFGPLPIVVLLVAWAAYDAVAVYGSGHMQELAAGATSLRAPIVFVVPRERGFSFREFTFEAAASAEERGGDEAGDARSTGDGAGDAAGDDRGGDAAGDDGAADGATAGEDAGRPAAMLGLGDAIVPGMLAVSAGEFLDAPAVVPALNANLPAVGAVLGGLVGMAALLYLVHRTEGVHAGLPPLNAGVLGGYLLGAVAAGLPVAAALGL